MRRTFLLIIGVGAACALLLLTYFVRSNAKAAQSRVVGTWRDATLDNAKSISKDDKARMQGYMVFNADGSGAFITGGFRKASHLNTELGSGSHTVPIQWTLKAGVVTLLSPDGKQQVLAFKLSPDGRTLSNDDSRLLYERFKGPVPTTHPSAL